LNDASSSLLELALELEPEPEPKPESDMSDGNVPGDTSFRGHSESEDNNGNESVEMVLLFLHIVKHNGMGVLG
jgi:hypothetical protein